MSKKMENEQKGSNPAIWYGATGLLLIIAIAVVFFAWQQNQTATEAAMAPSAVQDGLPDYNVQTWVKGNPGSENRIVAFSDYGCIHCARFHSVVEDFIEEYGDIIAFEKRHYPINNNYHSRMAAVAAVAAGKQGKFWEMSNLLYYNTDRWRVENPEPGFLGMAEFLELDMDQFQKDMYDEDITYSVVRGHLAAREFGINATPTVYLNGEQIRAAVSPQQLYAFVFGEEPPSSDEE